MCCSEVQTDYQLSINFPTIRKVDFGILFNLHAGLHSALCRGVSGMGVFVEGAKVLFLVIMVKLKC